MLDFIDSHARPWIDRLIAWSAINSGTHNLDGLSRMAHALREACAPLGAMHETIDLPPAESIDAQGNVVRTPLGKGLRFIKRPDAPRQVFVCIHYDTVYPPTSPFQSSHWLDDHHLTGPGVLDAKGGIAVMLSALEMFEEQCPQRDQLGWEIYLNPDEEIGSPGSAGFLREVAQRHSVALLFEPALADGSMVSSRKGSGNFTAIVRGKAAHAGRDFHAGRSATVALAELIVRVDALNSQLGNDVTINCGRVEGGGAVNVVPDLAIGRFNARVTARDDVPHVEEAMKRVASEVEAARDGIRIAWHGSFASPPKEFDERSRRLFEIIRDCGRSIGLELDARPSGGASDGNRLAAAGVAVIDSLGPVGGEIHSDREFVRVETIAHRARVTALVLERLAGGIEL
jgi:glutamate carboxypeptidase